MPDDTEAGRNIVEHLGDVLADPAHRSTALWALAARLMHHTFAWQVLRQRPAHRLHFLFALRLGRGVQYRLGTLQFLQPQLELLDLPVDAFGGAAKLRALEFRHQQLQVFDLGKTGIKLQTLLKHHRLEGFNIIGQCFGILGGHACKGVNVYVDCC